MKLIEKLAKMKEDVKNAYLIPGKIRKAELGYLSKLNTLEMNLAEKKAELEKVKFDVATGSLAAIDSQIELDMEVEEIYAQIGRIKKLQEDMWSEVEVEGKEK